MPNDAYRFCEWVWAAVGFFWLAGMLASKRAVRRQSAASCLTQIAVMVAAFALLFSSQLGVGPLGWRFLPESPAIAWTGLALTVAGCAFAVWARAMLGGNWSGTVTVKHDHQLIRRGPYAIVRHPIYSGGLLALVGTAIARREVRGLLGVALAFVGWGMKYRLEEAFMAGEFPAEYVRYRHEVRAALIPYVW
jgi:protein-S-isoprenylcysteine O-methyltransferase Ste14